MLCGPDRRWLKALGKRIVRVVHDFVGRGWVRETRGKGWGLRIGVPLAEHRLSGRVTRGMSPLLVAAGRDDGVAGRGASGAEGWGCGRGG